MSKKEKTKTQRVVEFLKKFRLVDLVGVGIFFAILFSSIFVLLRQAEYVHLTLRVSQSDSLEPNQKPPIWFLNYLKPGIAQTDGLGRKTLVVDSVYSYQSTSPDRNAYIEMDVRAAHNKKTNEYTYNGLTLLVGSYQTFNIQGIQITGVISALGNVKPPTNTQELVVTGYLDPQLADKAALGANSITDGVKNFLADKFVTGLEMKDNQGQIIAKIMSVSKKDAMRQFVYQNQFVEAVDPERKKVELQLEVQANKVGDIYLFRQEDPIIVGNTIHLEFSEFASDFTITDIQPK